MNGKNSKFSGSCEDAESLNLSEQSSGCDLNLSDENSTTTDIVATSKTMAGAAKTGSYNERRRSKNDENSAKRY
ncbi:hypothetical protein [uncultured Campylobacter sp.]|uniref:hypothetical protein n=1 Tax=uncultured Campylobacter sp. TaxID=218934 RepID=UPI002624BB40|nr:hypothetical protein [uncultured Campylobacter sp.]